MRPPAISVSSAVVSALSLLLISSATRAASIMTANPSQGAGLNYQQGIWKTNGAGTAVSPTNGQVCILLSNALPFGNNLGNARIRNPVTNATIAETWFADSLTLGTNAELRTKNLTAPSPTTGAPTLNFAGVGGNPGLILSGGIMDVGDDGTVTIAGKVQVASTSFICVGDNGAGQTPRPARSFTFSAQLSGSGSLVILQTPTNLAQTFSGVGSTYNGQWFVKAGRLLGATADSLGTNSITMDPFLFPPPPMATVVATTNAWFLGPAVVEANYTLNSAGVLTLTNGGKMRLHGEAVFSDVVIEGTHLGPGIHYYATELFPNWPANFDDGGSGALVVQPFGTPPPLPPTISKQPVSATVYTNGTARFQVVAADSGFPPLTFQWRTNGVNLAEGRFSGTTNSILIISNASPAEAAVTYDVIAQNASFPVTSSAVTLTLVGPNGEAYEPAVQAASPVAFYQLNETGDPSTNNSPAYDYVGGYFGFYGAGVQNGFNNTVAGPAAGDSFPGFNAANAAVQTTLNAANSRVSVLPWNLKTNTVTLTAWINPNGGQNPNEGLVFCRGGATVAGLCYAATGTLGYNWNNESDTFNWNSGLTPPPGQWSLVALVVTPTSATIYVLNTSGLAASQHVYNHLSMPFEGTTVIGDDPAGTGGNRSFSGRIDDVAVFNRALSPSDILALYSAASGVATFPPQIAVQPVSLSLYQGQTAQFTGLAVGSAPLTYQWLNAPAGSGGPYVNLTDGGQISGSTTPTLTITSVDFANAADYIVIATNSSLALGTASLPANLAILATNAPGNITITNQQASGLDWNTANAITSWLDGNGASTSAAQSPGNTYEVIAGARLRSPDGPVSTNFPGRQLTVDGDAVWNVNPGAGATIAEIRFKQHTYGTVNGTVGISKLVMNGGQLDAGNDGMLILNGEIDILTNAPINNDSGNDRGYLINSWLTGNGSIEYHGYAATYQSNYVNNLNIAGTSNTFSGFWNVVTGVLLGTKPNCLGTNSIIVGTNGVLETTYDIRNTNASLVLLGTGKVFLHQNDLFRSALINGVSLAPGTYSFATLNTTYSNNFPAVWNPKIGATNFTSGSGSLTVLSNAGPVILSQPASLTLWGQQTAQFKVTAVGNVPLGYQWLAGATGSGVYTNLSDAGNISGSTNTTLTITNVVAANGADYIVVVTNIYGSITSKVATLTIRPGPTITLQPLSQTLYEQQTANLYASTLGLLPLTFQWQAGATGSGIYTNLVNGPKISGATTTNVTLTNVGQDNAGDYIFIVSNAGGSVTSVVATITVTPVSPAEHITMSVVQVAGHDWDFPTASDWSDGLSASLSTVSKPGSTYEVLPGARMRSVSNAAASTFPGIMLTNSGDGVFVNNNGPTIGEIRFKHANPGTVFFQKLVMNGGQLDTGDNGLVTLLGEIDILANTPIYADNAAANDRPWQISAFLTGNASIEYHDFDATFNSVGGLNIAGTTNTYSGTWHVVQGVLLGSGPNSLGTNSITVDAGGALETGYDLNTPTANLVLNGQVFLHQNDTFRTVTIGSYSVPSGTYTFAQWTNSFPANFPVTWNLQTGSAVSSGSGSITVVGGPVINPITMSFVTSGGNLMFSGSGGIPNGQYYVLASTSLALPKASWTRLATYSFDGSGNFAFSVPVSPGTNQQFFQLQQRVP